MSATVSVVIPVYNGAETIGDTLRSLLAQAKVSNGCEVVVVDNGSTDGTREIVRSFGVTLLEEATRGPAAARNRGLRHATGDIIAHCDADTILTRRWFAEIVAPLADPGVALVAGQTIAYRPETPAERYAAACGIWEAERAVSREPFPFVPSLNMAVRRSDAVAAGGWDETLITGEDVDFSHRVLQRSHGRIAYAPKAILFHRNRASDAAMVKQARSYGYGAAQLYLRHKRTLPWTPALSFALMRTLAVRSIGPYVLATGARLGWVAKERAEFAKYHGIWNRAYWRGFFAEYRAGRKCPPQQCPCE